VIEGKKMTSCLKCNKEKQHIVVDRIGYPEKVKMISTYYCDNPQCPEYKTAEAVKKEYEEPL
jgi:hypothetical protein